MTLPREAHELLRAIQNFREASPHGTPSGVIDSLSQIERQITSVGEARGDGESPGSRVARQVAENATKGGTGDPMEKAAKGPDAPAPGQTSQAEPAQGGQPSGDDHKQAVLQVKDFVTAGQKAREYLRGQRDSQQPAPTGS